LTAGFGHLFRTGSYNGILSFRVYHPFSCHNWAQLPPKTGGSSIPKAIARIVIGGTIAMVLSAVVGYLFGVQV
jgi:hypothetical protein